MPPPNVAPLVAIAPQNPTMSAPFTLTMGVVERAPPVLPVKVVALIHAEPLLLEYMKLKESGPVPDARPVSPLSVMLVNPTVDVQN